jgi:phosphoribosylamine---glycine ligase
MKVLIVGGGGREHALAWKFAQDDPTVRLYAAPGNPGIAELAECLPIGAMDIHGLLAFARRESVALTVVGPEAPLAAGIVDAFRAEGLPIFGPTSAAAEIETSKAWTKSLMLAAGVPTARAESCSTIESARAAIRALGAPVVIKASGLAAGKGVIICETTAEADAAAAAMLEQHAFGAAGDVVLVEEFMTGEELSLFVLTDGERVIPLVPAQDHKRLLDHDRGPNTGGMGAYAPVSIAGGLVAQASDAAVVQQVLDEIVLPTLTAMRAANRPFTGLLYAGLMLTTEGPRVVEFNCRFGDPETQAVLPIMEMSPTLLELMRAVARGERLPAHAVARPRGFAVTTVLASDGYPEQVRTGDRIELPTAPAGVMAFHAGTKRLPDGSLATSGGRVLAITGVGPSIADARRLSQDFAARVHFRGKQQRTDIAWRELARHAGAS